MSDKLKKILGASITSICMMLSIMGCGNLEENVTETGEYKGWEDTDKDFSKYKTPGSQESNYAYSTYFLPSVDGIKQPYVGDPMPFYEDGIYYIYYLKDGGDSYNHSIYLATTTDFVTYEEQQEPVLEANRNGGQDGWIGTGSVVKIGETYYFFYTGHSSDSGSEYKEKIMVAKSNNLTSFEKVEGWEIIPDSSLGQKLDFRDPQAYYDEKTKSITMTITAAQSGTARILKYTLSEDLASYSYDGIIFTDPFGEVYNLECTDTFQIGDKYYVTYSAQDDTLWYAISDAPYGPYSAPSRLEGKLFYAAKHVEDKDDLYMVGWARRSGSPSSTTEVQAWGGNLVVQKIKQLDDGKLVLTPVDEIIDAFSKERKLMIKDSACTIEAGSLYSYRNVFMSFESFRLEGDFTFDGTGHLGLAFTYGKNAEEDKMIIIDPKNKVMKLVFGGGSTVITEVPIEIEVGKEYYFTYIQEGSVGVFYIENVGAMTVRLYGTTGQPIRLFAGNNQVAFSSLKEYTK